MRAPVFSIVRYVFVCLLAAFTAVAQTKTVDNRVNIAVTPEYVIQAEDEITVRSLEAKEVSDKTFRINTSGEVKFPMVGTIHLSGVTVHQAEELLTKAYKAFYFDPDIALTVTTLHTEPFSVLGAVGNPGVYPMKGRTTLLEAISAAGGARSDAGPTVILTRQNDIGSIPLTGARQRVTGESVVEINLKSLTDSESSTENVLVRPHDVISIPAAQLVYVVGNVKRAGGFPMAGRPELSIVQALALAEGFDPSAAPKRARILRRQSSGEEQIPVDMKKILAGKAEDVPLRPNDILFIPSNSMKAITTRTIEAAIQVGTGIAVFSR